MSTAPHFPWQAAGLSFCLLHFTRAGESTQRELSMTDDKAREIAKGLIQGYIGPDHKVINIKAFYSALVQALREAGN